MMNGPISRIVVTGDFLRVNVHGAESQNVNVRWLHELIRPALGMLTAAPVQTLFHERTRGSPALELFRTNGLEPSLQGWVRLYDRHPSPRDLAWLQLAFEDALVIAFELPEFVRRGLVALEIPYIDFTIHPVRFLDDLVFGVRSNIPQLGVLLQLWALMEEEIRLGAGLAMAMLTRMAAPAVCAGAHDWALFACQTGDDKVLIRDGRLMEAGDFVEQFAQIAARHERVLVKPHPYARDGLSKLMLTRLFPNAIEVDSNFYLLAGQPGISDVYSITSSTSVEARYFGKAGVHLAPYPYVFSDQHIDAVGYLQIRPAIHLPQFWAPLLIEAGLDTHSAPPVPVTLVPNRMRRSLRNWWGADIFMAAS